MLEVKLKHVQAVVVVHAIFNAGLKWFAGVLVGKIVSASIAKTNPDADVDQTGGSDLYRVVLMQDLTFETVAIAASVWVALNTLLVSAEKTASLLRAAQTGRRLRGEVLRRAVGNHGAGAESDIGRRANELVDRIRLVEDFQGNEEAKILYDWIRVALSIALVFVFLWYAGVLVLVLLILGELSAAMVERRRDVHREAVKTNAEYVNARLMDTIKNAVMVRITDMSGAEVSALLAQESHTDEHRLADARLRFVREFSKQIFINYFLILVPVMAWFDIADATAEGALQIATAVLISMLLLDEGHKSIVSLAAIFDKKLAADSAKRDLDEFLGVTSSANKDDDPSKGEAKKYLAKVGCDEEKGSVSLLSEPTRSSMIDGTGIALENITLSYPGRLQPVLSNVTRSFVRGKVHGLIGESGAGKSTTVKVVADLLAPNSGAVKYWKGMKIAYVSQDQNLFARTIRENVSYGAKEPVSDEEIWAALHAANIDTFIKSLPSGLDEVLTEGETMVSGGQLQRLHLAHLFCTWDSADLVLLDECLSALDEKSRDLMITRLESFLEGKTALVITHHSEMLRMCGEVHDLSPETEALQPIDHSCSLAAGKHLRASIFDSTFARGRNGSIFASASA